MFKSFQDFCRARSAQDLDTKIEQFCTELAMSGVPFDEWWLNHGLPTFLGEQYQTAEELLVEFGNPFAGLFNKPANTTGSQPIFKTNSEREQEIRDIQAMEKERKAQQQLRGNNQTQYPERPRWLDDEFDNGMNDFEEPFPEDNEEPMPAPMSHSQQAQQSMGMKSPDGGLSPDKQAKISASTAIIKQSLSKAMYDVVQRMKQNRDRVGYQVADLISQRLDGMIDSLPWKRSDKKFDHQAAFGPEKNIAAQTSEKDLVKTPEGQAQMAQDYAKRLGVSPDVLTNLMKSGFTSPKAWPGLIKSHQRAVQDKQAKMQQTPVQPAPQPQVPQQSMQQPTDPHTLRRDALLARMRNNTGRRPNMFGY